MAQLGMRKIIDGPIASVLTRVPEALKSEGFGILAQIDVSRTLKEKIGVEFRPYYILGACNPALAHRALQAELELGIMLPCNVIVYEADDGKTVVTAVDPARTIARVEDTPHLQELAATVREKLARALDRLQ